MGGAEVFIILIVVFGCAMVLALLGLYVWSLVLLMKAADSIPEEHRRMTPAFVFFMLIPIFSVVWAFLMCSRLSRGMESTFAERGVDRGDCGRGIGLVFATLGAIGSALSVLQNVGQLFAAMPAGPSGEDPQVFAIATSISGCFALILSLVGIGFYIGYVIRVHRLGQELRIQPARFDDLRASPPSTPM